MFKFGRNGAAPSPSEFSTKELQRIQRRFLKLSQDRYRVPISAFQSMPELSGNPFVAKILHLFDGDRDGFITLEEFTSALQWFRTLQHPEDKLSRERLSSAGFLFAKGCWKAQDPGADRPLSCWQLSSACTTLTRTGTSARRS